MLPLMIFVSVILAVVGVIVTLDKVCTASEKSKTEPGIVMHPRVTQPRPYPNKFTRHYNYRRAKLPLPENTNWVSSHI